MSDEKEVSRRWVLVGIGVLLNGAVALLIATPIVGYLLGPVRKKGGYDSWIDLGEVRAIPGGRNPAGQLRQPTKHALGWRHRQSGLLGPSNAGTEVSNLRYQLRSPWLPGPLVSAVRTFHVPLPRWRVLRRRLACRGTSAARSFRISLETAKRQVADRRRPDAHAGNHRLGAERESRMHWLKRTYEWLDFRLKLGGPITEAVTHPIPTQHRQLVVCLRQRQFRSANATNCHRDLAGDRLRPLRGGSLEYSAGVKSSTPAGMVSASHARLGLELHGGRGAHPHGAGVPVWRL